jgi:hypothetical protein
MEKAAEITISYKPRKGVPAVVVHIAHFVISPHV